MAKTYAELARAGALDELLERIHDDAGAKTDEAQDDEEEDADADEDAVAAATDDADRLAYKWMCAASDFGHEEADEHLGDLLEVTSLRYDDDGYQVASAHWELALAYAAGEEGLPLDLALADKHLTEALTYHDVETVSGLAGSRDSALAALARLSPPARALLDFHMNGGDHTRRVLDRIARLQRLRECSAPEVIVAGESRQLQQSWDALVAAGPRGLAAPPGVPTAEPRSLEAIQQKVSDALAE